MKDKNKEILSEKIRKEAEEDNRRRLEIREKCKFQPCYADCLKLCDKG